MAAYCNVYADVLSGGRLPFTSSHCLECNNYQAVWSLVSCQYDIGFLESPLLPHTAIGHKIIGQERFEFEFDESMTSAEMIVTRLQTRTRFNLRSGSQCMSGELFDVMLQQCVSVEVTIEDPFNACHDLEADYHRCTTATTINSKYRFTCSNGTILYCDARMEGFFNHGGNWSALVVVSVGVCATFLTLSVIIYCHNNDMLKPIGQLFLCQLGLLIVSQLLYVALPQTLTQAQSRACSVIGISFLYVWLAVFCAFLGGSSVSTWYLIRRQYNHPHLGHIIAVIFVLIFSMPALIITAITTSYKQHLSSTLAEVVMSQMFAPERGCFLYVENFSLNLGLMYPLAFTSAISLSLNTAAFVHVMRQQKMSRVFSRSPSTRTVFVTQTACIVCFTLSWFSAYLGFSYRTDYLWLVHYMLVMMLGLIPAIILLKTMCLSRIRRALSRLSSMEDQSTNVSSTMNHHTRRF